jgi:hypothetical protein
MERGDDSDPRHAYVHQTLDCLEKGFKLLLGGNGTIAPVLLCFLEEVTGVWRQGHVNVAPEVEPPLMPPLVR